MLSRKHRAKTVVPGRRALAALVAVMLTLNVVPMVAPGVAVAQERPSLTYFALGDSYASGHGLGGDVGADKEGKYGAGDVRNCRRSPNAYPYLVASALSASYTVDFDPEHHLACSGATAGPYTMAPSDADYHPDKSISHQFKMVNDELDERDDAGRSDPVLVTITIGANDIGLMDPDTWGQVARRPDPQMRVVATAAGFLVSPLVGIATGVVATLPTTSAVGFFEWLDAESTAIYSALTPGIDNLLAHENVYIVLTDYPIPVPDPDNRFFDFFCNDIFLSLSCYEAVDRIVQRLNSVMVDQFLAVNQPGRLRVATLRTGFSSHPAGAPNTWFQDDYAHPNDQGAQGIGDIVVERAKTMLAASDTTSSASGTGSLTVEVWDNRNNMRDTTSQCVQLAGVTETLCSYDSPDGLIHFDGIPAGTYEICVTRRFEVPAGEPYWAWARSLGPVSVTIAPGSHEAITLYVFMVFQDPDPGDPTLCGFDDTTSASGSSADSAQDTWGASVQVSLCDESSNGGTCQAGAGVVVDISLASGEWMGSCTTSEPMPTPWDVFISTCTVEGLPYHADFVATQDPSTIPAGYVPVNDPQTLHVEDIHPGGGDQATFMFTNVRTDAGASTSVSSETSAPAEPSAPTEVAVTTESTGTADPMSLLPSIADIPGGLIETGRRTRSLPEVAGNYTDPAEATQLFTEWGWQGNAVASFALPSGQQAQSGQVNGVYVSIHQFPGPDEARAALDFSLTEQAAGTSLQEITASPVGEYSRALYGPMDYGNETTVLTQQGRFFIRVSVAMLDGDPTADAVSVTEAILLKVASVSTNGMPVGSAPSGSVITPDSSGAVITPDSGGSAEATLLMTFRGCPEGFDPTTGDFYAECTIPLDAPDASFIYWGVKLENDPGGMHITRLERQDNGAYIFPAGPGKMDLNISYLSPVVRDAYQVIGADNDVGTDHLIYLADGETREVYIFYWFT